MNVGMTSGVYKINNSMENVAEIKSGSQFTHSLAKLLTNVKNVYNSLVTSVRSSAVSKGEDKNPPEMKSEGLLQRFLTGIKLLFGSLPTSCNVDKPKLSAASFTLNSLFDIKEGERGGGVEQLCKKIKETAKHEDILAMFRMSPSSDDAQEIKQKSFGFEQFCSSQYCTPEILSSIFKKEMSHLLPKIDNNDFKRLPDINPDNKKTLDDCKDAVRNILIEKINQMPADKIKLVVMMLNTLAEVKKVAIDKEVHTLRDINGLNRYVIPHLIGDDLESRYLEKIPGTNKMMKDDIEAKLTTPFNHWQHLSIDQSGCVSVVN
ncbi:hypothetical protein QVN42_06615 [Yersinia nurmii]|uniref:Uncharacterized protein n=1 Tax=Yersinia nurmii TaxID=685706 RepID=A0AAW7K6E4_9GAMM|nr:hypothetical protein [Yersinia nurmii]MDN0087069.1 hypothetical protein [Yersinia nurmii]CNE13956.1 Uncharacterised protein [Yersinia nurmii]